MLYDRIHYVARAEVMVGPGLASEGATLGEVLASMQAAGYPIEDIATLTGDQEGWFAIPLNEELREKLCQERELMFSLEIPEEARDPDVPKPEFASHVTFHLEI